MALVTNVRFQCIYTTVFLTLKRDQAQGKFTKSLNFLPFVVVKIMIHHNMY